jgi:hypothetical protein
MPSALTPSDSTLSSSTFPSRLVVAAALLAAAWLAAYAPTLAGGFIRDDFGWIYHSRLTGWSSLYSMFANAQVFYRPMVQLSFGLTEWLFGINPLPYALTNLALGIACAIAIYRLARATGLAPWAALTAAAVWAFNFHGINMAVIWLSGRTSLLGTLFSLLSALALVRNRAAAAGILAFAAFLSKEEVIALPLILTIWLIIDRVSIKRSLGLWIALALYFALRNQSGAIGISDAPPFYRFVFDPAHVLTNIVEYADRSSTLAVLVVLAAAIGFARLPKLEDADRRLVVKGLVWLIGGFAATIWLPVRSSLYAVFPSVGTVLMTAAVVAAMARLSHDRRATRLAAAACLLPFVLLPLYWQRNVRWTELRYLSAQTIRAIQSDRPEGTTLVVLHDDLTTRANFRHVFAGLLPEASAIYFGGTVSIWIEPPPPEIDPAAKPASDGRTVAFRLVDGRVEPIRISNVGN